MAVSAARLLIAPLRNPCDGAPALRDLAAIRAQNQLLAAQGAQAGGVGVDLEEDARSETLSHSYSDAESSASSIGRGSAASSSMASIGKRRRAVTSSAVRGSPGRPPMRRQLSTFTSKDDQRLRQLVAEHGGTAEKWTEIARSFGTDRSSKQCRERCPPARARPPGSLNSSKALGVAPSALRPASLPPGVCRWHNHLSPKVQNKEEWTEKEEELLGRIVSKIQRENPDALIPWARISPWFEGRTAAWSKCPLRAQGPGLPYRAPLLALPTLAAAAARRCGHPRPARPARWLPAMLA